MLPDVDADDGDVGQEWVLIGSGDDFEGLALGIEALFRTEKHGRQYWKYHDTKTSRRVRLK